MLSGNLPLIITGGEAWGNVDGAETNGKLDFFTELERGGEDPYIDKPSAGRRSGEVLQTRRRGRWQTGSDAVWHLDTLPAARRIKPAFISGTALWREDGMEGATELTFFPDPSRLLFSSRS